MALEDVLLPKVKDNLIITHDADDGLIKDLVRAAIGYAEGYQHVAEPYTEDNPPSPYTERGIIMLASHEYESRDGSTGGFFADSVQAAGATWDAVHRYLLLDRKWSV
jgi:uncharacterized phage protein (predicted DNA packaging)